MSWTKQFSEKRKKEKGWYTMQNRPAVVITQQNEMLQSYPAHTRTRTLTRVPLFCRLVHDLKILSDKLQRVEDSLARKYKSKEEYEKTIAETETQYMKVCNARHKG